ncbi:MAG: peptide deformylase [Bacilli bacterium]|nr:peptide deformylase [Bacilli bacterium]
MFKIVKDNKKSLRERSIDVELPLSDENRKLLLDMIDYLKKSQDEEYSQKHGVRAGVGLAAPQIGINKKLIAIYYPKDEKSFVEYGLANPRIVSSSLRLCCLQNGEGCLSVDDDYRGFVYRSNKITVKAFDVVQNKEVEIIARGYDAIVLQHEIDHLYGVLFYDHINKQHPFEEKENAIKI